MENVTRLALIKQLEELIESVSHNEHKRNNRLRGKTRKIIKITNYLKALSFKSKEKK